MTKTLVWACMVVALWSCTSGNSTTIAVKIPALSIATTHQQLKRQQGKWFYQNKPFSGTLVEHYPSGKVKTRATYYEGEKHGIAKGWYPEGQRWFERRYERGRKHGKQSIWWQNGQLKLVGHTKKDAYEGNVKKWFRDGRLFADFNYKDGKEEGHQRIWKTDGRIKANYVVKNGRQYGLTGVKNCKSVTAKASSF